jgi:hypothetical protein
MDPLNPTEIKEDIPASPFVPQKEVSQNGEEYKPQTAQMRTFSTDLAEELRKHQGSAMKIAVMENEKRFKQQEALSDEPQKNRKFVLLGLGIVLIAALISAGVYFYQKKINTPPIIEINQSPVSIIHSENLKVLNVSKMSRDDISKALTETVAKATTQNGMIDNIYITQGVAGNETRLTSSMFLSAVGSHITKEFSNSLTQEYMVGIYAYTKPSLFLVLRGTQHDYMLSGMLQWEPYFLGDLAPVFDIDTTGENSYLLSSPTKEKLIENHDTRAVVDNKNNPVLFYSFLDANTVIITNDSKTLSEGIRRMSK